MSQKKETPAATGSGKTAKAAQATGTVVYCGPSVKHLVRQYAVYSSGLPAPVAEFVEAHKAAKALTVPLERFAATRCALETPGTAEAILYAQLKKEL